MPVARHANQLTSRRAYRLEPQADPTYSPQIGALVEMMTYVRLGTLKALEGLSTEELDYIPAGLNYFIGMLLARIVAMHRLYQGMSLEERNVLEEDAFAPYRSGLTLGEEGEHVTGHPLDWYLAQLAASQTVTLAGLAGRDDNWLASTLTIPKFDYPNHHWVWFRVIENEINQRGKLRVIRQLLPGRSGEPHQND